MDVNWIAEPSGKGRSVSGLPADLVLEKDTASKKGMHEGRTYTLRLLIYRPGKSR